MLAVQHREDEEAEVTEDQLQVWVQLERLKPKGRKEQKPKGSRLKDTDFIDSKRYFFTLAIMITSHEVSSS